MKKRPHNYSLKKVDDTYFLLDNGEHVCTPNGNIVSTNSEKFAELLVKNANDTKGSYFTPMDILCYHYSTIDFANNWNNEERQEIIEYMSSFVDSNDPFLMFRQVCPVWIVIAKAYKDKIPQILSSLTPHRLMCFLVITQYYNSPMLAHYIVSDIINTDGNYKELKHSFLIDLEDFCSENDIKFNRKEFDHVIDIFVSYYSLDNL
jgi:hypothetical protein